MGRKSKAKFKMSGHTLPGINQKSETVNLSDGRSPSSAFQYQSPMKNMKTGKYDHPFEQRDLGPQEKMEAIRKYLLSDQVGLQSLEDVDNWIDHSVKHNDVDGDGNISEAEKITSAYEEVIKMMELTGLGQNEIANDMGGAPVDTSASDSPLEQKRMRYEIRRIDRSKSDPLHGGDFSDNYSFGDAFAAARSNVGHGGGYFTWQGNKYTTERADDVKTSTQASDSPLEQSQKKINKWMDAIELYMGNKDFYDNDDSKKSKRIIKKAEKAQIKLAKSQAKDFPSTEEMDKIKELIPYLNEYSNIQQLPSMQLVEEVKPTLELPPGLGSWRKPIIQEIEELPRPVIKENIIRRM